MQNKNALGTDPFKWLKESNKKEDTKKPKSDIDNDNQDKKEAKKPDPIIIEDKEIVVKREEKQEKKQEKKPYEPINVSETLKMQENKIHGLDNVTESNNLQEESTFEQSDVTELNRKAVLGNDAYGYHAKPRKKTQKGNPATAFVIAYTVLMLILGFIVYRDLAKQIDRLEIRLETVEKKLAEGLINYEDTKLSDVW